MSEWPGIGMACSGSVTIGVTSGVRGMAIAWLKNPWAADDAEPGSAKRKTILRSDFCSPAPRAWRWDMNPTTNGNPKAPASIGGHIALVPSWW